MALRNARLKSWRHWFSSRETKAHLQKLIDACVAEIRAIEDCIAQVEPHRKYRHLPDPEAHQACQEEEWMAELKWRAENYLLTGGIPHDQLAAMRLHPAFPTDIWPHIERVKQALKEGAVPLAPPRTSKLLEAPCPSLPNAS